jgi:hypothetical protein
MSAWQFISTFPAAVTAAPQNQLSPDWQHPSLFFFLIQSSEFLTNHP